ncbi:diadenylate cyclase [Chitiniphilus purpureus]|uniref:Diadenylate cyclase n=1 Tax=Chitiniphilus purpureus TaxID=2981137 RepID=A0ABY6DM12_9NEIS|nr:diadenylate cyclase [Chitiniphilus sp. CD1]UXY14136.1 diadenylate cyclase [Chitiniphilus sp. CD1]
MNHDLEHRSALALQEALHEVACRADRFFTGTSVVVCHTLDGLPYHPMNEGWPVEPELGLADNLLTLAHRDSPYHDGFHLLTPDLRFIKVACYLAPGIPDEPPRVSFAGRGSRFSTAYFMSLLRPVVCVGIVGIQRDVTVFRQGTMLAARPPCRGMPPPHAGRLLAQCS